jgi:uncharacterized caspase-like protein
VRRIPVVLPVIVAGAALLAVPRGQALAADLPATGAAPPTRVVARPKAPDYDPKRWALVIGVSHYEDLGGLLIDLHGPHNDARRISEALINKGHFDPRQVIVVADETPLLPTRDNILQQLDTVTENAQDGLLVLFFAGHGLESDGEAYLLPRNVRGVEAPNSARFRSSAVPVSEIRKHIAESGVKHVVLFLDACRDNPRDPAPRGRGPGSPRRDGQTFRSAFTWNNSVTIFSTQTGQEAFETGGEPSVGYFADALARALSGDSARAINGAGEVTIGSLMDYLPDAVDRRVHKDLKRSQRPQILADTGGSIALAYPGTSRTLKKPDEVSDGGDGDGDDHPPPKTDAHLRLRLPQAALARAGLVVTRNKFSIDRATLDEPMALQAGKQFLVVDLPGYRPWSRDLDIASGETVVDVQLEPKRLPIYAGLSVALVGVGAMAVGIGYGLHASSLGDEVTAACKMGCDFQPGSPLWQKDQDGQSAETKMTAFLITGGLLAAGGAATAAYFYWSRPPLALGGTGSGLSFAAGPRQAGLRWGATW